MKSNVTHLTLADSGPLKGVSINVQFDSTSEDDRASWAVRGLSRLLQRAAASGGALDRIDAAQAHFEQASEHLDQWRAAVQEMEGHTGEADVIRKARDKAAKSLRKLLPDVFPVIGDALAFADGLPLSTARREAAAIVQARTQADRRRKEARKQFWQTAEQAAQLVAAGGGTTAALDNAIESGRYE